MSGCFCSAVSPLNTTVLTTPDTHTAGHKEGKREFQEKLARLPGKMQLSVQLLQKEPFFKPGLIYTADTAAVCVLLSAS